MNQILDYNPNKSSGGGSSGSDKVVRVFAILLICFAICLLVGGVYSIYKNKEKTNKPAQAPTQAQITVEQEETVATIKVSHDKAIEKLIYSWDSGKENNVKGNGEASMEVEATLLAGKHKLNIKVIDIDGVETTYEKEITSENGEDKIYPEIAFEVTDEKKLRITATDETAIDFVTYRWNDGEEKRVDVSDDDKKIVFEIDILKGQNDLLIVAVDKNNNTTTEPKVFTGVTKPDVKITISSDKKTATIVCFHEKGIKDIKLNIDNQDYDVTLQEEDLTEVKLPVIELPEGDNVIKVKAISVEETETEVTEEVKKDVQTENNISISIEKTGETALATLKSDDVIKEVKLNINGMDYDVTIELEDPKELELKELPLEEGNNKITIKVITANGSEKEEVKEIER